MCKLESQAPCRFLERKDKRLRSCAKQSRSDNLPYEKVGKNDPVCIADEVPFEIPDSWEWVRLDSLVIKEIKRGKSPKYAASSNVTVFAQKCNVKAGGIDLSLAKKLDISVFPKYPVEEYMIDGDIVVNSTGNGTLGRIGIFRDSDRISNDTIVPDSHVTVIRSSQEIIVEYIHCVLEYYQPELEKQGEGSTNQTELKPAVLANLFVPVPPKCEQRRIVNALTLLRKQIIDYDYKEKSLSELNRTFPDLLKKSVLQQAVMGKLVPQDPNDEPASVLLERIRAEKQALIKSGKLKKDKHESIIYRRDNSHYEKTDGKETCIDDSIPFEIPQTWEWVRLGSVISIFGRIGFRGYTKNDMVDKGNGAITISPSNIKGMYTNFTDNSYISWDKYEESPEIMIFEEDLLLVKTGSSYGKCGIVKNLPEKATINPQLVVLKYVLIDRMYLLYVLNSSLARKAYEEFVIGTSIPTFSQEKLASLLIPLPPLSEQERIVESISSILPAICAL